MTPKQAKNVKIFASVFLVGIVATTGAVLFGRADKGQIDVSAAIGMFNQDKIDRGEGNLVQTIPNPLSNVPNGGLVGTGKTDPAMQQPKPKPKPEVEGSATSTDETASSSEETAREASGETTDEEENAEADTTGEEGAETTPEE